MEIIGHRDNAIHQRPIKGRSISWNEPTPRGTPYLAQKEMAEIHPHPTNHSELTCWKTGFSQGHSARAAWPLRVDYEDAEAVRSNISVRGNSQIVLGEWWMTQQNSREEWRWIYWGLISLMSMENSLDKFHGGFCHPCIIKLSCLHFNQPCEFLWCNQAQGLLSFMSRVLHMQCTMTLL